MLVSEVPAFKEYWYPVAYSSDVADKPFAFRLLSDNYVVWRGASGSLGCAVDECPHRAARLSQGWLDHGDIVARITGGRSTRRRLHAHSAERRRQADPRARALSVLTDERYGLLGLPGMPRPPFGAARGGTSRLRPDARDGGSATGAASSTMRRPAHVAGPRNTIGILGTEVRGYEIERDGHRLRSRVITAHA
jgi:hypothetical protein